MEYNQKKGFTFIELIMVIVIMAVLSGAGAFVLIHIVKNSIIIPNQLNVNMLASDVLDLMVEGDGQAKGLRFSREITRIRPRRVDFINQDGQTVRYRFAPATGCILRRINSGSWQVIPYYWNNRAEFEAINTNIIFKYYNSSEVEIPAIVSSNPATVRRLEISLRAKIRNNLYPNTITKSEQSTSVSVKKYQ